MNGFHPNTEILTEQGWKFLNALESHDFVATKNIKTNIIEFQKPISIGEFQYSGEIYSLKSQHADLKVGPSVKILSAPKGERYGYSTPEQLLSIQKPINFTFTGGNNNKDYDISDDWIKLISWIISDGSVLPMKTEGRFTYVIYQREEKCHLIEDLLNKLGVGYKKYSRTRTIESICGKELKKKTNTHVDFSLNTNNTSEDHLLYLNSFVKEKYKLPKFLFKCSERQVGIFMDVYMDANGIRKAHLPKWSQIDGTKDILEDLQRLLVTSQSHSRLAVYREKSYRMFYYKDKIESPFAVKNLQKVEYSGVLHTIQVPNENVVLRVNGIVTIQGDSQPIEDKDYK